MPHRNKVKDSDPYFEIDAVTRQIKNLSTSKTTVIQYDHNSERFTFSLPRYIESHDMGESTKAEVHYTTKDAQGVYTIKDLRIDEKDETKVKCTWLLSQNVTKTPGAIRFLLRFSCIDAEGNIEYAWNTAPFLGISVTEGIYNTEAIVEQYADVLEQLKNEVVKDLGIISSSELDKITEPGIYVYGGTFNDYYLLSVYTDLENGIYRQRKFDLEGSMIREGELTQPGIIKWSDWVHNGSFGDIPTNLSDLEDDLKIKETIAKKLDKTEFEDHREGLVATHEILFNEVGGKLDREWQIIGEAEITEEDQKAGKTDLKAMAINNIELDAFVELMAYIYIPKNSLNSEAKHWHVGLSADTTTAPNSDNENLTNSIGLASTKLTASDKNYLLVHSVFVEGAHLLTDITLGVAGSYKSYKFSGVTAGDIDKLYYATRLAGKHAYWFITSDYKLPAGTKMILYAR
jgi:hypothetical protein